MTVGPAPTKGTSVRPHRPGGRHRGDRRFRPMLRDPADTVALAHPMPTDHSPITDLAPTTSASVDPSTQRRGEPIAGTSRGQRLLHLPRARSFSSTALPTDPSARFPFRAA